MSDWKTTDPLTDIMLLNKAQELRATLPNIEVSRGFNIVQGYLMATSEVDPNTLDTHLTWVPNEHDATVHFAGEEEVQLGG